MQCRRPWFNSWVGKIPLEKRWATHSGILGLPWWLRRYIVCLQYGRPGFDPWVRKIRWRRKWQPTPVSLPGEFHGQRSLVGYSPWDRKESDSTEQLNVCIILANLVFHWRRQWHPTPVLLPGKSHGRRSLVGCSPWGRSDTTERLHFHFSLSCIGEGNGNPLQCSCLENPRDGGAWWAAVYGVAQSRTQLK